MLNLAIPTLQLASSQPLSSLPEPHLQPLSSPLYLSYSMTLPHTPSLRVQARNVLHNLEVRHGIIRIPMPFRIQTRHTRNMLTHTVMTKRMVWSSGGERILTASGERVAFTDFAGTGSGCFMLGLTWLASLPGLPGLLCGRLLSRKLLLLRRLSRLLWRRLMLRELLSL